MFLGRSEVAFDILLAVEGGSSDGREGADVYANGSAGADSTAPDVATSCISQSHACLLRQYLDDRLKILAL